MIRKFFIPQPYIIPALVQITILGFILRLVISWYSTGTNDAWLWQAFAHISLQDGLLATYKAREDFNHPLLPGLWSAAARWLALKSHLSFFFIFKLPMITADAFCCLLLWKIYKKRENILRGWQAAACYSWCLNAILVSGYHCNTDSIYAFFILLAFYLIEERKFFTRGGMALAAGINIKLIPVFLIMPLYALCRRSKDALWLTGGLATGILPFLPLMIFLGMTFFTNVISYNSRVDNWGIMLITLLLGIQHHMDLYVKYGRFVILIAIAALSWWAMKKRAWNGYELGAMALAIFLIMTPGFGVQYTIALTPILFAASLSMGVCYGLWSGLFLLEIYARFFTHRPPLHSQFLTNYPPSSYGLGLVTYFILILFVVVTIYGGKNQRRTKK